MSPDLLADGESLVNRVRPGHLSRPVTYERDGETVGLNATVGETEFPVEREAGVLESVETRDYIVRASDLVLGGGPITPERGDRIRETDGGTVYVYEVMAPGRKAHWRWSGRGRTARRIHTKLVDREEA
ncbi:MAG: hypothetical protein ACOC8E_08785 [Planctomycetota bacterium]